MFKSKSFDLKNEDSTKLPENLYQPRRIRWMKYILVPVAVCFVLLLIICNVDFSTDLSVSNHSSYKSKKILCIANYNFSERIITKNLLDSSYTLDSLTLTNCSFTFIEDGAFDQSHFNKLQNLELINTQLLNLTSKTFQGLHKLQHFSLFNKEIALKCDGFMTILAETLCVASIHQQYSECCIYTPSNFFGHSIIYKNLRNLNLDGNNFGNTLKIDWFYNMPVLESLSLADCRFDSIDFDNTVHHFDRLRYLDLSENRLLKLSNQFIAHSLKRGIGIIMLNHNRTISKFTAEPNANWMGITAYEAEETIEPETDETTETITESSTESSTEKTTEKTTEKATTRKPPRPGPTPSTIPTTPTTPTPTTPTPSTPTPTTPTPSTPTPTTPTPTTPTPTTPTPTTTTPLMDDTSTPTPTTPSTTSPDTTTTPEDDDAKTSPDPTDLICLNSNKETIGKLPKNRWAKIRIVQHNESALYVSVSQVDYDYGNMVYFSHPYAVQTVNKADFDQDKSGDLVATIKDFYCNTSYVFCLLQAFETTPFSCQSHQTMICAIPKSSWYSENSVWIISLGIVGILLFAFIGGCIVYGILWHRPTWLCGSKRLQRTSRDSLTMLLLPPNYQKGVYGATRSKNGNDAVDDYVAYYRHLEQAKLNDAESNKYNIPPQESAPPAPPKSGNNIYECFDLYEELF